MMNLRFTALFFIGLLLWGTGCSKDDGTDENGAFTIYAVTTGADSTFGAEPVMEPIVVVRNGQYTDPTPKVSDTASTEAFDRATSEAFGRFFVEDKSYFLLQDGNPNGSVRIVAPDANADPGDAALVSPIKIQAKNFSGAYALATNVNRFKDDGRNARSLHANEVSALLGAARQEYAKHGVAPSLLDSISTNALRADDLEGNGRTTIAGDFIIEYRRTNTEGELLTIRDLLFVIAEQENGQYVFRMAQYGSMGGEETAGEPTYELLDVLDVNSDGRDEIFVRRTSAASYDYVIYDKQGSAWKPVYQGGGGGL